jgi:fused signal recognition particle receptor
LGLLKSRREIWSKLDALVSGGIDENSLGKIEELLYTADVGPTITEQLVCAIKEKKPEGGPEVFKVFLKEILEKKLLPIQAKTDYSIFQTKIENTNGPHVILVTGVNGAGKTTTIGKLATKFANDGAKVVVGACDTFRAAAVDQLQIWCTKANAEMVRANDNADPASVAFSAFQRARQINANYCIIDTAGRLHTKTNLMEELKKIKRVLTKLDPSAPHQVLLVLDAITGQNALRQAEEFHKALDVTGLVFTKCDGSAKAGSAVGILEKLGIPIVYVGVGESVEDLNLFNLDDYLNALLDITPLR